MSTDLTALVEKHLIMHGGLVAPWDSAGCGYETMLQGYGAATAARLVVKHYPIGVVQHALLAGRKKIRGEG